MAQLVTRIGESLVGEVDDLVAKGIVASRSEAVRDGLGRLVDHHRRRQTGEAIADGYRKHPQTSAELAGLEQTTRALVMEEPW